MATLKQPSAKDGKAADDDYINIMDEDDNGASLKAADGSGYAWQEAYKRSWDVLKEDESGSLLSALANVQQAKRRKRQRDTSTVQRGIIRNMYLVLDMSKSMSETDLHPTRWECAWTHVSQFILEYFDQNPLSLMGIIVTRDGVAEKLTELEGNPKHHLDALRKKENRELRGEPSLQNALELARESLRNVPSHGTREALVIFGSLTTCDPGNIFDTLSSLKSNCIRVSVVGLAAEVDVCRKLSKDTRGTYGVAMSDSHFKDLLFESLPPPPIADNADSSDLIQMGFPMSTDLKVGSFCSCHQRIISHGYLCPRCKSMICELPIGCPVCKLTLVSSPLLARSYHHLFPVDNFIDLPWSKIDPSDQLPASNQCFACQIPFPARPPALRSRTPNAPSGGPAAIPALTASEHSGRNECPKCRKRFCNECDSFVHDVLHNCPGCLSMAATKP
ncbi:Ssl1-like-domain-containing protein [Polychytrium aggregatum]|uniref:Ssl1-like-domain-containing protein n=1 Tax=Polychytrium aggregatum TaxID=110093 RepID=UPI0022FE47DF|nr:Ssl1-like-domain-containing protein [Polychytrium aggregatum]KAI9208941.1 Ssl1-like-domain-containing protein [Polychytrium aggregatum]